MCFIVTSRQWCAWWWRRPCRSRSSTGGCSGTTASCMPSSISPLTSSEPWPAPCHKPKLTWLNVLQYLVWTVMLTLIHNPILKSLSISSPSPSFPFFPLPLVYQASPCQWHHLRHDRMQQCSWHGLGFLWVSRWMRCYPAREAWSQRGGEAGSRHEPQGESSFGIIGWREHARIESLRRSDAKYYPMPSSMIGCIRINSIG